MRLEGGFQGRTNKLVDSCYSYWMAALFPILGATLPAGLTGAFAPRGGPSAGTMRRAADGLTRRPDAPLCCVQPTIRPCSIAVRAGLMRKEAGRSSVAIARAGGSWSVAR